MKKFNQLVGLCLIGIILGCKKNDDSVLPILELQKEPPLSFNLVDVPDKAEDIDVTPILSWESAENPRGTAVTYDLYLDTDVNPTSLYESNIDATSFELTNRLNLLTNYHWKVVARDVEGKASQSPVHKFTTRNLNFPADPISASAEFQKRDRHSSVVFDDKMWVIGGFYDGDQKNDVWYSGDGETWNMATASAQFSKRTGQATIVFDNKIWVIGGWSEGERKNDVWYSSDGIDWTLASANADFPARAGHTSVVFDDKMWILGGAEGDFQYLQDIWYSSDGVNWVEAIENAAFPGRTGHTATVFDNKIWVIGGAFPFEWLDDIWYSSDGVEWIQNINVEAFSARSGHTSLVFANNLWVIGGRDDQGERKNDMWYSSDGSNWTRATPDAPFPGRQNHTSVAFGNKLWVIAGFTENGFGEDVWSMD